jgi:hypothetical protein
MLMLVRMAALVAGDTPPVSSMLNRRIAGDVDFDAEEVERAAGDDRADRPVVTDAGVVSGP